MSDLLEQNSSFAKSSLVAIYDGRPIFYRRAHLCRGQALAELVVGLVALIVLLMGMLFVQYLGHNRIQTLCAARVEAGQAALGNNSPAAGVPVWIDDREAGSEGTYSADDSWVSGNPMSVITGVVGCVDIPDLQKYAPVRSVAAGHFVAASTSGTLLNEFALVHGQVSTNIDLLDPNYSFPLIRSLVYRADSVLLKSDVWLARMVDVNQ